MLAPDMEVLIVAVAVVKLHVLHHLRVSLRYVTTWRLGVRNDDIA